MKNNENLKIGITGPISETNFGDYAMLINNIYDIDVEDITVFSYNKGFSEVIMNEYCNQYHISIQEVLLKESQNQVAETKQDSTKKVGFLPFRAPTKTPLDILLNSLNYDEIYQKIEQMDVLIVNGGGYFNHLWNNSLWRNSMLEKIVIPILIANQQNKKIVFTGNSFGPFDDSAEFFMYLFNYLNNTIFAVRDKAYSRIYLNHIGISNDRIVDIPDDLFIINEEILSKRPLEQLKIDNYMVLELYYSLDIIKEKLIKIKEFSEEMYNRYQIKIVFLPLDLKSGGMEQGEYLKEKLQHYYLYDIAKNGFLPIQDAKTVIKNAKLVLCTRYHAAVLAVGSKTPVINIVKPVCNDNRYYFNKTYGLLKNAFEGEALNELLFMRNSLEEAFEYILNYYKEIENEQNKLYNGEKYIKNMQKLRQNRENYFKKIMDK